MRLYYMTSRDIAEIILRERRMKLSLFHELNDPFELLGASIGEKDARQLFRVLHSHWAKTIGIISLSDNWKSPVMWAHYAQKHYGLCFGFDIPDDLAHEVQYQGERLKHLIDRSRQLMGLNEQSLKTVLLTKYKEWSYEREWRLFGTLKEPDPVTRYYYLNFGKSFVLREVIIGARCPLNVADVVKLVGNVEMSVTVRKARAAFTKFEIVKQGQVKSVTVRPARRT